MSLIVSEARRRTRFHLRDRDRSGYAFSTPELDRALESNMRVIAGRARLGQDETTLAITSATDTYTMPGSLQYMQLLSLRLASTATPIKLVTREEFDIWRNGIVTPSASRSDPQVAVLLESAAQALTIQFFPWPHRSDTVTLVRSVLPTAFVDGDTVIPFDDLAGEALCYETAAELVTVATDDALEAVKLSRASAGVFHAKAESLLRDHRIRRARQRGSLDTLRVRS